ncbi:hypothetical protein Ccrd_022363 [Cynara cardunculus var. scolymus]|uniref:non-specific serine/threonine protein kinase n=1 Tax=Cynara cardunculus var. scolymus TaxID=59895 RepID=A0A103XYS9_CYNCS|nr:hypothetical protein Ccrd_022363 [Cynara cardunculus var. scolymus]
MELFLVSKNMLSGPLPQKICVSGLLTQNQLIGNISQDFGIYPELDYINLEDFDSKHIVGVGGSGTSFKNEIPALTEARHQNIVKLYGFRSHPRDATRFWYMSYWQAGA